MRMAETFFGSIETTRDALLVLEASRQGVLNRVKRRISHEEKDAIRHGSVFVFDEKESKMKRWTDNRLWTPSRINGNFLIYREAQDKIPKAKTYRKSDRKVVYREGRKEVTGSKGTYAIKPNGLVKRTLSVQIKGATHHLVSYHDPLLAKLPTPQQLSLNNLQIGSDLLCGQGFKRALDQNGDEFVSEGDDFECRDRTLSISSSMELHSAFDSIWNRNQEIVHQVFDFEASIRNEYDILKSPESIKANEIPCSDFLDIEEIAKDLLSDEVVDDVQMPCFSSCDINFEEFLLLDNSWK